MAIEGKPYPADESEQARWLEGELRLRMLEGQWVPDLDDALLQFFAPEEIARLETTRDTSREPFTAAMREINTLWSEPPTIGVASGPPPTKKTFTAELCAVRQQSQLWTLGLGEAATRIDVVTPEGRGQPERLTYRAVPGCALEVRMSRQDPTRIEWLRETRPRTRPSGAMVWVRETFALGGRVHLIEERDAEGIWNDATLQWVSKLPPKGMEDAPPEAWSSYALYVDSAGEPVIPYELHHVMVGGPTWTPQRYSALVRLQLYVGCLRTFWLAGFRDNAYPTRYGLDVELPAARQEAGGAGPRRLLQSPSLFLEVHTRHGAVNGSVGTLEPTFDIEKGLGAIDDYIAGALQDAGLGPGDEAPAKGVSGYAIIVSRESKRQSQRLQTPAALQSDQRLFATAARLWNSYIAPDGLSERPDDYSLTYHGIPLSTAEVQTGVDRATRLLDAGLTTRWRALLEVHPHLSEQQARDLAAEIEAERSQREQPQTKPQPPNATTDASGDDSMDADVDETDANQPETTP